MGHPRTSLPPVTGVELTFAGFVGITNPPLSFRGPTVFVGPRNLSEKFLATLEMTHRRDPSPAAGSVPHHEWDLGCPILALRGWAVVRGRPPIGRVRR